LAGPLLDWAPGLSERYNLVPWGVLVRIVPRDEPMAFPPLETRSVLFGNQLRLEGYNTFSPEADRCQLWFAWCTTAPTLRDLLVSVRLHASDGSLLMQEDGRLASLWFPEETMPEGQPLLTVFDLEYPDEVSAIFSVRIVVYDPHTMQPLVTTEGESVLELRLLMGADANGQPVCNDRTLLPENAVRMETTRTPAPPLHLHQTYLPFVYSGR
jgi:hypothetical protein